MKKTIQVIALATTSLLTVPCHAFEFTQTIETPVNITNTQQTLSGVTEKDVTILSVKLTEKEKQSLANRQPREAFHPTLRHTGLPPAIQLGMNGVPVLNQGRHGSCVTFAQTAALDAVIGKGDYISQLCSLELGLHLEKNGYMPSGWSGSLGPLVLNQLFRFGIVSKTTQLTKSCADVTEYPVADKNNTGNEMSLTEYKATSEDITNVVYWQHLFSNDQAFDWKTDAPEKMRAVLDNVKAAILKGHRLTIGAFLIIADHCRAGACAAYQAHNDTWALTSTLETPPYTVGGHELVITGYDDQAIAYDNQGGKHQGLLTLRNSWGADVGDHGNYYMSYDYFVKYANEVQEIIDLK